MRKVKIGVIGAGGIALRKTIPGMLKAKHCKLMAVMDVANVEAIAKKLKVKRAYTKEEDLVDDPQVEAVYIASPAHLHLRHILLAASRKKHILCEKPLTLTLREARQAIAACKRNRVFLQEGFMMKFHGGHQRIRELIAARKIGKVVYIRAQLSCWYPPIKDAWRQNPKMGGGGSLIDMANHLYDLVEFFTNDRIKRVAAVTNRQVQSYRSEDSATTLLELSRGTHATVDTFFCVPDEASKTRLEIYGSRGTILSEGTIGQGSGGVIEGIFGLGEGGYDATQNKDVATTFRKIPFPRVNPYTAECEYFAECVARRRAPKINNATHGLHLMNVVEKAYASYKTKRILTV